MKARTSFGRTARPAATLVIAFSCLALAGFAAADKKKPGDASAPLTVPKATCGPNDHPETDLQGQVSAALRASGFKGFNCNLELISQSKGDGANWQTTEYRDPLGNADSQGKGNGHKRGTVCAYHGSASPSLSLPGRNKATLGVPVIDISEPSSPVRMGYLQTTSMLDPWESLKVNEKRQLLAADNGQNGGGGPEIDIYDISNDCRFPQLLASVQVGTGTDGGAIGKVIGHEGSWAPDGLTYYGGDIGQALYYAVDTVDPTHPKLITLWKPGIAGATVHGLSMSDDGNRAYVVSLLGAGPVTPDKAANGLLIYDTSEIQARKPNPQVKLVGKFLFNDGGGAQHTIPIKIEGKPYVVFVDETGPAGFVNATDLHKAADAGLPVFPMARIIDISDETNPKQVSRLMLETHDPANFNKVIPDLTGLGIFMYGSHYCSVDNKQKATTLACGYFNSGIRVFDIRDPARPKEIAYFNPPGTTTASVGSNHPGTGQWRAGGPDWCSAQVHLNADDGTLWTTCQDNGFVMLKFTNGVWPFAQSKTPPGQQN
ncbi:MAG TPA: hypothetical protein VGK44_11330 [Casimicrobiaceae bacterium]